MMEGPWALKSKTLVSPLTSEAVRESSIVKVQPFFNFNAFLSNFVTLLSNLLSLNELPCMGALNPDAVRL